MRGSLTERAKEKRSVESSGRSGVRNVTCSFFHLGRVCGAAAGHPKLEIFPLCLYHSHFTNLNNFKMGNSSNPAHKAGVPRTGESQCQGIILVCTGC